MPQLDVQRRGLMFVLSSPSGAGKSTLARSLLEGDGEITMSVSVTTRPMRPGEVEGKDYYFVSREDFGLMVNRDELLEHAKVFDHYYGTPAGPVEDALAEGRDVLFDIDWQGAQQLTQAAGDDLVKVFILPPSRQTLEERLFTRAQDSAEVVAGRMAKANDEISHWAEYDYVIINADLEIAKRQVRGILESERLKRRRQPGLADFVKQIQEGL
ncbi:MAG: guanylate kinase [Alphaproteobacteria bacterium]|nr:MAG: guanylate kinase [Alphaproteobacteria bacterium]